MGINRSNMSKVFVYGSLKQGYWNNSLLRSSELLFRANTVDKVYKMVDLGSFPAVVKEGDFKISGEVYNVDDTTLQRLDALEGNGSFYMREEVLVEPLSANPKTLAWIYILIDDKNLGFNATYNKCSLSLHYNDNKVSWGMVV